MPKIINNYTLTDLVGQGQYGKVYKAYSKISSSKRIIQNQQPKIYAVKCISLSKLTPNVLILTQNELQSLRQMNIRNSQNIIEFVQIIRSQNYLYIVYEFCEGGTLSQMLQKRQKFSEKQALKIFSQLINAFKDLHALSIIHRDVKPQNIFFKNGVLKLADFGFCKKLKFSQDLTQTSLGSPLYMAPQVLNHDIYSSKVDVWSCGIVLYEMLFGVCPFGTCNINQILKCYKDKRQINFDSLKTNISRKTQIMLRRMLEIDQIRRLSWEDFLYQYSFSQDGQILHKEKDFQYDLMRLMKKTSIENQVKYKQSYKKIDWQKILELNSSVHSQQFQVADRSNSFHQSSNNLKLTKQDSIKEVVQMKRTIKQFQSKHGQFLDLSNVIQQMIQSQKQHEYNTAILYFLVYNLGYLIQTTLKQIKSYVIDNENQKIWLKNKTQKNILDNLILIFEEEQQKIKPKINSIKCVLLQLQEWERQVFKYPQKSVTRKYLNQFIQNYQEQSKFSTKISRQGNLSDSVRLLKIIWGVSLIKKINNDVQDKFSWKQIQTKNKVGVCALMNKLLNDLQV